LEKVDIGVVVPAYNEEENIKPLYDRLAKALTQISEKYEILFVDDGSHDKTVIEVEKLQKLDKRVKYVSFSRNFGHEMANTAGFRTVSGDAVVIIDADLQDPPEVIIDMFAKFKEGYDIVYAQRLKRDKETWLKKATSRWFYRIMKMLSDTEIPLDTGDFRLLSRRVVDEINNLNEKNRFFRGLTHWVGFDVTYVEYDREARHAGETKYNYLKLFKLAFDAILSFSYKPLKIFSLLGFATAGFAFLNLIYWVVMKAVFNHQAVEGWTSIVTILLLFFGIIMIQISVIGEYIARIYEEVRNRPLYIISKQDGQQVHRSSESNKYACYCPDLSTEVDKKDSLQKDSLQKESLQNEKRN